MTPPASAPTGPTVLVVDDDAALLRTLQALLEQRQFRVLTAPDGLAALEVVAKQRPSVILLDIDMPKLDGESTALRLRSKPEWRTIPIIMLTGIDEVMDQHLTATLGVVAYLRKPCEPDELYATLQRALGAPAV